MIGIVSVCGRKLGIEKGKEKSKPFCRFPCCGMGLVEAIGTPVIGFCFGLSPGCFIGLTQPVIRVGFCR